MTKIAIIGAGNIGGSYYKVFGEAFGYDDLYLINRSVERMANMPGENKYTIDQMSEGLKHADMVIIAVKPQQFDELIGQIAGVDFSGKLFISAMAGVSLRSLSEKLGTDQVIRVMPNIAIKYKKGVTGWLVREDVTLGDFESIFAHTGLMIRLTDEKQIMGIITTAGSGLAYIVYFLEQLVKAAMEDGLSEEDARAAARMTIHGLSAELSGDPAKSFEAVRTSVTSKGGITWAAVASMKEQGLEGLVKEAVSKARQRDEELSGD